MGLESNPAAPYRAIDRLTTDHGKEPNWPASAGFLLCEVKMKLETVFVNRDGVKVMINKSDFDAAKDKLWDDKPVIQRKQKSEEK